MKTTQKILFLCASLLLATVGSLFMLSVTESPAFAAFSFVGAITPAITNFVMPGLNIASGLFSLVNIGSVTFSGKEVQSMSEAIMESVYQNPEINSIHMVAEGIVADEQIVFLGILSKITKKNTTCGGSPTAAEIDETEKYWRPVRVRIWVEQCADDLEASFWVYAQQKGIKRKDLTKTDFADFIMQRLDTAIAEDLLRIVWFNDTDHETVDGSPAGVLASGVDITDYTIIDGLWKQLYDVVSADADRYSDGLASRNGQATYAAQKFTAADTTNKVVHGTLQSMIDDADPRLSEAEGKGLFFLVTKSVYNQYKKELKSYTSIEAAWLMVQDGQKVLAFDGIPVIPMTFWDRTIKADFKDGTKYYQPHRALLTVKENIPVGLDALASVKALENFYLPKEETNNWKGGYKVDAKVLQSYLVQVAY